MKTKSQVALEYLMVVGLAFVIIMPMVYMFYSYTVSTQEEVGMAKIHKIGVDIVNAAEGVYYLGEPSRSTLNVNMPAGIYEVEVLGGTGYEKQLLVFKFGDAGFNQPIVIPSKIPLNIDDLKPEDISAGRKVIVIEAATDEVRLKGQS